VSLLGGTIIASWLAITASKNAAFAEFNAQRADREADIAQTNEKEAIKNSERVRHEKKLSDSRFYASEMKLASLEWEAGQTDLLLQRLARFEPNRTSEDPRGFEWLYLQRQSQLASRSFRGHENWVRSVAFSSDGRLLASGGQFDKTVRIWNVATGQ